MTGRDLGWMGVADLNIDGVALLGMRNSRGMLEAERGAEEVELDRVSGRPRCWLGPRGVALEPDAIDEDGAAAGNSRSRETELDRDVAGKGDGPMAEGGWARVVVRLREALMTAALG